MLAVLFKIMLLTYPLGYIISRLNDRRKRAENSPTIGLDGNPIDETRLLRLVIGALIVLTVSIAPLMLWDFYKKLEVPKELQDFYPCKRTGPWCKR